jgi:hypothetical protein
MKWFRGWNGTRKINDWSPDENLTGTLLPAQVVKHPEPVSIGILHRKFL